MALVTKCHKQLRQQP